MYIIDSNNFSDFLLSITDKSPFAINILSISINI